MGWRESGLARAVLGEPGPIVVEPGQALVKSWPAGPAAVERSEEGRGHTGDFSPADYGAYAARSVAVYRCQQIRAQNLRSLPIRLWKGPEGKKKEVTKGKLYDLLARPNPFYSRKRLVEMTEMALCSWGKAFLVAERGPSGRGVPTELWWVRPDRMWVIPHPTDYLTGFVYEHAGTRIPFLPSEVVWFRYANPLDEYEGLSPIASSRLTVETQQDAIKANANFFKQGMQLGGIISPADKDVQFTPEQVAEYEQYFSRRFRSVDKAHRWAVLSGDAKVTVVGSNPKDAMFMELMRWGKGEIATAYGVAPELIGDHEHATYSNVEQAEKALWTDTLVPEADFLSDGLTGGLLPMFPGEADEIALDTSMVAALQEDRTEVTEQALKWWGMGVPLNRVLTEFMPHLLPEGEQGYPWGDQAFVPSTVVPVELAINPPKPEPAAPPPGDGQGDPQEPPPDDGSAQNALDRALVAVKQLAALPPPAEEPAARWAFGSAEHEKAWRAFDARAERHEAKMRGAAEALFRAQEADVLQRLGKAERAVGQLRPVDVFGATADRRAELQAVVDGLARKEAAREIADDPFDQGRWAKRFKQEMLPLFRDALGDAGEDTLAEIDPDAAFDLEDPGAIRWLEGHAQRFAREVNATTWDALRAELAAGVQAGEGIDALAERVRRVMGVAAGSRSELIARTEVIAASTAGGLEAAKQSGVVTHKEWLSALDGRVRDTHREAHGQRVALDAEFAVGGSKGQGPGQMGSPSENCNCRCALIFVTDEGKR